jgi:hypothetical protein
MSENKELSANELFEIEMVEETSLDAGLVIGGGGGGCNSNCSNNAADLP